jgi:arylsulfatase A-like enzyme
MNVLVFCIDTLRQDHLPIYGYKRDTAPTVTKFAKDAMRFNEALTVSTFTFSVASSIVSGLYPAAHGALSFDDTLAGSFPVLPELLSERGYRTAVFAGMSYFGQRWGLSRGFDRVSGTAEQSHDSTGAALNAQFADWLDDGDDDFFTVLWSFDAHKPYVDIADEFTGHPNPAIDDYDNGIRYADEQFARTLEILQKRDLLEDTLVVLMGDHGEVFDEHHWIESSKLARFAVQHDISIVGDLFREDQLGHTAIPPYEEAIQIPLLLRFPGGEHAGSYGCLAQPHDLAATIAEFMEIDQPTVWQSHSLVPDEHGDPPQRDVGFVLTNQTPGGAEYWAARNRHAKVVKMTAPSFENDTLKFYLGRRFLSVDRQSFALDGGEHRVPAGPEHEQLFERLDEHRRECRELTDRLQASSDGLDEERREQLEAMGYL